MSRDLTGAMVSQVAAQQLAPLALVELEFLSDTVRFWTGYGTLSWDAKTWIGAGHLLGITPISETRDIEAVSVSTTLSGVDPATVSLVYNDFCQGRPKRIWFGALDVATGLVVNDPVPIFAGRMDTISDTDDGNTVEITVSAESNLADLKRLRARYYTDQDQQRLFPGDRSLRYMPSLQDRQIYWGVREGSPQLPQIS